jgi:dihydroorotase
VQLIEAPDRPPRRADVLLQGRAVAWIGRDAADPPPSQADVVLDAGEWWLGPALVDPHSVLEEPWQGRAETLDSLGRAAASGGYGWVALLPWAPCWRDRPDRLDLRWNEPLRLLLWGSFSLAGADADLAPHADQIEAGAVGLAGGEGLPPLPLLERGMLLDEHGGRPLLLAPRDAGLAAQGFVRERVEALRAGFPTDPVTSETVPLRILLELAETFPDAGLRLMNLSTAEAVAALRRCGAPPPASVSWWHLVADSGGLDPADEGWRLVPPLGGPSDRQALLAALEDDLIDTVAIHHRPLDAEERLLPLDQRRPGLAGHGVALPLLWEELVRRRGWSPQRLWRLLCWGPARFLGLPAPQLTPGCRRWILVDPQARWCWDPASCPSLAANQPAWGRPLQGRVVASGLVPAEDWPLATALRGTPSR